MKHTLSIHLIKRILSSGIFLLVFFISHAQTDSSNGWNVLPKQTLVKLFTADTRAHRLSMSKPFNSNGYIASMGGIFPLIAYNGSKRKVQLSAASTVYTTLRRWTNRGLLVNVDFFVDVFGDLQLNKNWAMRGAIGHTSQHLTDDAIAVGGTAINYTRDYGQLFGIYNNDGYNFSCYFGTTLNTNLKTTKNYGVVLMPQLGFEHSPVNWNKYHFLYYAADVKFRGEHHYGTIQNVQAGYKYTDKILHAARLCFNYTWGYEERGQFYKQQNSFTSLGFYFDF